MTNKKSSNSDKSAGIKKSTDNGKPVGGGKPSGGKKRSARPAVLIAALLLLAVILLLLFRCPGEPPVAEPDPVPVVVDTPTVEDSVAVIDTIPIPADTVVIDTVPPINEDSLARARVRADSLAGISRARRDSLARARADSIALADSVTRAQALERARADSLALADSVTRAQALERARADSVARADSISRIVDPCARDTLLPWVYADPSGGQHRRAVSVRLVANKECRIEWRLEGSSGWNVYDGSPINISSQTTLYYRAQDSCGKRMEERSKRYTFDMTDRSSLCPPDMEYIKAGGREFCVDVYEWPNRRGVLPNAFVSLYQAMDSCFSVRKRLCTSDEWTTACAGPENWMYTYGGSYESNTCATRDTLPQRSGARPECRGYFGVFDMSGNLAEWTSTQSPRDRSFNNVMGGFWMSGTQSRCADARYSYFPQNRHNPVGFRCCRDTGPEQQQRRGR